jgi:hypothetical protein
MRTLSKSKLLAFRQCSKRLWLEVYRRDLSTTPIGASAGFTAGQAVGEAARRDCCMGEQHCCERPDTNSGPVR